MSHYVVAVFTEEGQQNIEDLLERFDENMVVERYVSKTKEQIIEDAKKHREWQLNEGPYSEYIKDPEAYIKENNLEENNRHLIFFRDEFPKRLEWTDEETYQEEIKYYEEDDIGENGEIYSTYNPNSKWDWYEIGGRWSGLITTKNGNRVDSAKVKDIDFSSNKKAYDSAIRFWEVAVEGKELKDDENNGEFFSLYRPEYYTKRYETKENYAKIVSSFSTYAVLTPDGKWHEPGEMGYWGMSAATPDDNKDWDSNYYDRFIKTANPEWTMTIVDCHI